MSSHTKHSVCLQKVPQIVFYTAMIKVVYFDHKCSLSISLPCMMPTIASKKPKPAICSLSSRYSCMENKLVNVFTEQVTLFSNLNVNFGNMSGLK